MTNTRDSIDSHDPFNLSRFEKAQKSVYNNALAELKRGEKRTHWMWYIFPQFDGLGFSATSKYYAIGSIEEARQYLNHPVLGSRLLECTEAVLAVEGRTVSEIFGYPDDLKFRSSMTLFAQVSDPDSPFIRALDKYFHGRQDDRTLRLLGKMKQD